MRYLLLLGFLSMASAVFAPNNIGQLRAATYSCVGEEQTGLCTVLAGSDVPIGQGTGKYGVIGDWDVSKVTSLDLVFYSSTYEYFKFFDQPIGNWNVSSVESMAAAFQSCTFFNQNIGNWDVSSVTNLERTFQTAMLFNQDLGNWNVSKVTNMRRTFYGAFTFNQNLENWDVRKVTNMEETFRSGTAFNGAFTSNWVTTLDLSASNTFRSTATCSSIAYNGKCNCAGSTRDECGVCGGSGLSDEFCDCDGNTVDACGVCGGDGSGCAGCDGVPHSGLMNDSCGVCNGPGDIYECGCSDIPAGKCDCAGGTACLASEHGTLIDQTDCGTSLESANRTQLETQYSSFCTE